MNMEQSTLQIHANICKQYTLGIYKYRYDIHDSEHYRHSV